MKWFILSNANSYGGAEKSLELLSSCWYRQHILYIFVENDKHAICLEKMTGNKAKVIRLKKGKGIFSTIYNLCCIFYKALIIKPDIWLSNTNKGALYLSLLYIFLPIKRSIVYVRDFQWNYSKFIFKILKKSIVALPTIAGEEYGDNRRFICKNKVIITGNPIIITAKCNGDFKKNDDPYILVLANIARWKGLIYLIKAYKLSGVSLAGVRLRIYGNISETEYYNELCIYIKENDLEKYITISRFIDDVTELYRNAEMVVNTSVSKWGGPETFGRTIVEAWSYSKPVIAFNTGGPKYLIDDNINGFLVPEGDVNILSNRIKLLIFDKKKAEEMGKYGLKKAIDEFYVEKVSNYIYKSVMN